MKLFAESRKIFPDPQESLGEGIVALREDLNVETLLEAYSFGIFPWPMEGFPLLWFCPPQRGILELDRLHVPRRLARKLKNIKWEFRFNTAFEQVIEECSCQPRPLQSGTWITPRMKEAYIQFHKAGYAHSVECWEEGKLIGGMYGVYVAGSFSGESMFYKTPDASKACLLRLIDVLKKNHIEWMDCQMVTPHMEKLGARYVSKLKFLKMLEGRKKVAKPLSFY